MARKLREDTGSNTIKPDEFLDIVSEVESAQRKIDVATAERRSLVGQLQTIRQRAKKMGTHMEALDMLLGLRRLDEDDRQSLMAALSRYSAWLDMPLGTQAEMDLGDEPDEKPSPEAVSKLAGARAYGDGFNTRKVRADSLDDNPHTPGSSEYQQWSIGWHDCDTENPAAAKDGVTQAPTERRPRRGRRASNGGAAAGPPAF